RSQRLPGRPLRLPQPAHDTGEYGLRTDRVEHVLPRSRSPAARTVPTATPSGTRCCRASLQRRRKGPDPAQVSPLPGAPARRSPGRRDRTPPHRPKNRRYRPSSPPTPVSARGVPGHPRPLGDRTRPPRQGEAGPPGPRAVPSTSPAPNTHDPGLEPGAPASYAIPSPPPVCRGSSADRSGKAWKLRRPHAVAASSAGGVLKTAQYRGEPHLEVVVEGGGVGGFGEQVVVRTAGLWFAATPLRAELGHGD